MLNSITEIDRKGLFGRQASGAPISGGRPCRPGPRSRLELNAIARVGQDLDHKAFELDEFFLGHFFIDAQVPEKAITTLTRGFPLSSVSSCTWTRIITSGFFARAFAHSCSIQLFGLCEHLLHKYPRFRKFSPFVSRSAANQDMIAE